MHLFIFLVADYFGTRQIIFRNNMNTIEMHYFTPHPTQYTSCPDNIRIHVSIHIAEYNLSGSKIISNQMYFCSKTAVMETTEY